MKKWLFSILTVLLIAGGSFTYYVFKKEPVPVMAQMVSTTVQRGDLEVRISGSGVVSPIYQKSVTASETGIVAETYFEEGDIVEEGQVLIAYENEDLSDQIEQEQIRLEQLKLDLNDAQKQYEEQQKNLQVTAPQSGNIVSLNVKEGDEVQSNMVLGTIQDANSVTITVPYNSADIQEITIGQKAEVILLDALATVEGQVIELDRLGRATEDGLIYHDVTIEINQQISPAEKGQVSIETATGKRSALEKGTFVPAEKIDIKAKASGIAAEIFANKQDYVQKGQAILQIDTELNTKNIDKLKLDIEDSQNRIISYQEDQQGLDPIVAPISGQIINKNVATGNRLTSGQTIAEIKNYEALQVTIAVDELDISKVQVGQQAEITVAALSDKAFAGEVTEIADEGTSTNGVSNFDVTLRILNPEGIKSGMSAGVTIITQKKQNVLFVPIEAVQILRGRSFVLIEKENLEEGQANTEQKTVEVGINNEDFIEITSGLSEGEEIILTIAAPVGEGTQRNPNGGFGLPGGGGGMGGIPGGGGTGRLPGSGGGAQRGGGAAGGTGGDR